MSDLKQVAQQALTILEAWKHKGMWGDWDGVTDALRAALAEHDKKIVWVEERKAHWAEQLQLARENQERERQQREEAALAEPVQEPVAWMYDFLNPDNREEAIRNWVTQNPVEIEREKGFNVRPLYTSQLQRKPLTEEEMLNIIDDVLEGGSLVDVARAIERAHGIGGQDE